MTEMVWSGISVPDPAIGLGWKIESAAKMLGVYAALNPERATTMALPGWRNAPTPLAVLGMVKCQEAEDVSHSVALHITPGWPPADAGCARRA